MGSKFSDSHTFRFLMCLPDDEADEGKCYQCWALHHHHHGPRPVCMVILRCGTENGKRRQLSYRAVHHHNTSKQAKKKPKLNSKKKMEKAKT